MWNPLFAQLPCMHMVTNFLMFQTQNLLLEGLDEPQGDLPVDVWADLGMNLFTPSYLLWGDFAQSAPCTAIQVDKGME